MCTAINDNNYLPQDNSSFCKMEHSDIYHKKNIRDQYFIETIKETSNHKENSDLYIETKNIELTSPSENNISVFDVAQYVLKCLPDHRCSTMKLHKLLYYCQAWSLVWNDRPLFKEKIEAWANGPVIRELFVFHKGLFSLSYLDLTIGNEENLSKEQEETINDVLAFYGNRDTQWLIDLTHSEDPWRQARKGLKPMERGKEEITLESMNAYYSSL